MPTELLKKDISGAHLKALVVELDDNETALRFVAVVNKPNGDKPVTTLRIPVTDTQAEILLKLSGR